MQQHRLTIEDIQVGERLRALSDQAVSRLADSMREIGLKQPITVRIVDEMMLDGDLTAGVPVLVTGAHRLAAGKLLGWSHIDCLEVEDDPLSAEMWEIAENLHRLDLTKDQRDDHIRRYADLLNTLREVSRQNDAKPKSGPQGGRPEGVASQVARETGLSKRTVERALNPQPPMIKVVMEPESEHDAIIREANAIVSAWNRARQEARDLALEQIDEPVFDRTRSAA